MGKWEGEGERVAGRATRRAHAGGRGGEASAEPQNAFGSAGASPFRLRVVLLEGRQPEESEGVNKKKAFRISP